MASAAETEEFLTGSRSQPELDRVVATVMFTDSVGLTKRAAERRDRNGERYWFVTTHGTAAAFSLSRA
jgi:hypothetical protein